MLHRLDSMLGSSIVTMDGEIGKAYNIFFDDRSWAVRYLVIETGSWFRRRKILISPAVLGSLDWGGRTIPVLLTKEQVQNSPDVDVDQPVSRQQELAMARHYDSMSLEAYSPLVLGDAPVSQPPAESETEGDPHLRSAREVAGYLVDASDGALGNLTDFIIDDQGWGIFDLVVNVVSPPYDHKVLVPTKWVAGVSWDDRRVQLSQPLEKVVAAGILTTP
jgi:hypothetical protein